MDPAVRDGAAQRAGCLALDAAPEPAFGRCTLNPGPKGPGTSCFLIGNKTWQQVIVCAGYSGEFPEGCVCSCIGDKWAQKR